jgi:hypothetical protein
MAHAMKALAWSCVVGFVLMTPFTSAAEPDISKWQALDASLEKVVSGGFWEREKADGVFRVLVLIEGREHIGSRVLLQWVRRDADQQDLIVEKTIPIKELAAPQWRATDVKFVRVKDQWQIRIPVMPVFEGKNATFTITPDPNHTYRITSGK